MSKALDAISARIERLAADPDLAGGAFKKLVSPILRAFRWEPKLETERLGRLLAALSPDAPASLLAERTDALLRDAVRELDKNTSEIEQACAMDGKPPAAHVTWLYRLYELTRRAEAVVGGASGRGLPSSALLAHPLVVAGKDGAPSVGVTTVDPLLEAAAAEQSTLGRRRRLLEAARQALLDSAAAVELDPKAVEVRQAHIADEIALIDRLEAAGVAPDVALVHQARTAVSRGAVQKLHAVLVALDGVASRTGDAALSELTGDALDGLWGGRSRVSPEARAASLSRSSDETFSKDVRDAVARGVFEGRRVLKTAAKSKDVAARHKAERALAYLTEGVEDALLLSALHVDGCFDVGGVLCPERAVEEHRRLRQVTFPTQALALLPACSVEDVPGAVIDDPRRILFDLAAGRLLTRRYLVEEIHHTERTVMRTEVRAYVLDGSGSMLGPRAMMRDAILLAELSTLMARYEDPARRVEPVLHYRYFDVDVGPVARIDSAASALAAIERVTSEVHTGGTNIQHALVSTLEDIRAAKEKDTSLVRAQIVLVTDGAAPIDRDIVLRARGSIGEIPVGISIIALGMQNEALRELAAFQRARGEAVFYHFMPDDELAAITEGRKGRIAVHLPIDLVPARLGDDLGRLVEEMDALGRSREDTALCRAEAEVTALDDLGVSLSHPARGAARARVALLRRDEAALARCFERWFPFMAGGTIHPNLAVAAGADAAELEQVKAALSSVAIVVDLVGGAPLERQVDAIEIIERLLLDEGVPPWRYAALLRQYPVALGAELEAVRHAVEGAAPPQGRKHAGRPT